MTSRARAVAQRYGTVARAYRSFWSPVMVALSQPLIEALPIEADQRLLDMGCGVGAIASTLSRRAREVVGVDLAEGMLRQAKRDIHRVGSDLVALTFASGSFDGAYSTFALQHVPFPSRAFREAVRVLRPGGFIGTVTWGVDHAESGGAYAALDDVFARHQIPEEPPMKTWHSKVDRPAKMRVLARRAGLHVARAWEVRAEYRWSHAQFFGWATSLGPYGRRLSAATMQQRERAIGELEVTLAALGEDDFLWTPLVVFLIATAG